MSAATTPTRALPCSRQRLYGRLDERLALSRVMARAEAPGGCVVLEGSPGAGASALLDAATSEARRAGYHVVRADATQSGRGIRYAALAGLVDRVRGFLPSVPAGDRSLLHSLCDGGWPAGDERHVAEALIAVLRAMPAPVVVMDDLHWLDPSSRAVVDILLRAAPTSDLVLLCAARKGGAPSLHRRARVLRRLDETAVDGLLDDIAGDLAPATKRRVARDAEGNPLALHELVRAWREVAGKRSLDARSCMAHPLMTDRLARSFALRTFELPHETRAALLVAALDPSAALGELVSVTGLLLGHEVEVEVFAAAEEVGLAQVTDVGVRFDHRLTPAALLALTPHQRLREAHHAYLTARSSSGDCHRQCAG